MTETMRELVERARDLAWDLPESSADLLHVIEQIGNEKLGNAPTNDEKMVE